MPSPPSDNREPRPRAWRALWSMLVPDERARRDVDAELQAHVEARIEYLVERGMAPDDARAEALRRFGDLESARRVLRADAARHQRRLNLLERLRLVVQDARYVVRGLRRSPSFTAGVVATLALGLGINAAVFQVADMVLLRPPAGVQNPRDVRRLETTLPIGSGAPIVATMFSYPDARRIETSQAFADVAMYSPPLSTRRDDGQEVMVSAVDDRYFPLLGVRPVAGRAFDAREAEPGAQIAVAVVSHEYWRREWHGSSGDTFVKLGDRSYRVIGVAPPRFTGIDLDPVDVWLPLGAAEFGRGWINGVPIQWYQTDMRRALRVIGRPPPGVDDDALEERVTAAIAAADRDMGRPPRSAVLHSIVPVGDPARYGASNRLVTRLVGVAAIVLLIACANATNLLLARAIRRHREMALRMAIGASRARVTRLLVLESLVLALAGGAAALLCGTWTADGLRRLVFPDVHWTAMSIDVRTLLFTGLLTLTAGMCAALAPAVQWTSPNLAASLREIRSQGGPRSRLTRAALVVLQTGLCLTLLVGSGLLVLSLLRLGAVNLGFDPRGLVIASVSPAQPRGDGRSDTGAAAVQIAEQLADRGGGAGVGLASIAPFGATSMRTVTVPGSSFVPESDRDQPLVMDVSANYFHLMGTRVLRGRAFDARDTDGAEPVSIVNVTMARRYWGGTVPAGSCILVSGRPCARIVGVVEDVREAPGTVPPMRYYLPLAQGDHSAVTVIVRADEGRKSSLAALLRSSAPSGYRVNVELASDRVARALRPWRTAALLFAALGAVAVALACVGVYSVMNYLTSERVHELGIRVVLGATSSDVLRMVLADGLRLTALGALAGLLGAAATGRLLGSLLFDVSPLEPSIYAAALLGLALAGIGAMLPPALRAARVDPVAALRTE